MVEKTNEEGIKSIVALSIKTFLGTVVLLALVAVLYTTIFPLSASRFYSELGLDGRAYACARRASKTLSGEEQVNALVSCVNLGGKLLDSGKGYAKNVVEDTTEFLSNNDCLKRCDKMDDYNISTAPKTMHPNLYSYETYIYELRASAKAKLGESDTLVRAVSNLSNCDVETFAIKLGEISSYLKYGESLSSEDIQSIKAVAKDYFANAQSLMENGNDLKCLYLIKQYQKVAVRITELLEVEYNGENHDVNELYGTLLKEYSTKK